MQFLTIENPIRWLFLFHAIAGSIALVVFLIPLFSKKGSKVHVKVGWIYVFAMSFVGVSAFIITPWRGFFDPNRTSSTEGFAVFLFFISVLTLSSIWMGLEALKLKSRLNPDRAFTHIAPPMILVICAVITQVIGYLLENNLLMIFPVLGYVTAAGQLQYWLTKPKEKRHWWYAHMQGMGIACIATVTAFLVTALPRFVKTPIFNSPLLWVAPGIIGGTLLNRSIARDKAKFKA